jgi:amidophosphoribosyltransferase
MASAAPPVRYPNVYGIDMPTKDELVAHNRTVEQIREIIGCDALIYQDVDAMKSAILKLAPKAAKDHAQLTGFDASCFDGVYVTGDITDGDLTRMRDSRSASAKQAEDEEDSSRLALPNHTV